MPSLNASSNPSSNPPLDPLPKPLRNHLFVNLVGLIVAPPRWVRLFALLVVVAGVAMLFYFGSKPIGGGLFSHPMDKVAHFCAFGSLGAVAWVMLGGQRRWADFGAILIVVLVGTADETMQRFIPTREASLADLTFDIMGACVAVCILTFARSWFQRKSQSELLAA
ncbi:MAG: VanZ family protein [Burkholderiaceae bacterium]